MKSRRFIQNPARAVLGTLKRLLCCLRRLWSGDQTPPQQRNQCFRRRQRKRAAAPTPEQMFEGGTNTYNNWVEVSAGGFITSGNKAEFRQQQQKSGNVFGGIEDLHYQAHGTNGISLSVDGRAMFDEDDYRLRLEVSKEKLGYLRFTYSEFQTWYNGDGAISVRRKPTTDCPAMGWRWIGGRSPLKRVCDWTSCPASLSSIRMRLAKGTRGPPSGGPCTRPMTPRSVG
jgi:hypothetical protein